MTAKPNRSEKGLKKRRDYSAEYRRVNKDRVREAGAKWRAKPESKNKVREYYYLRTYGLSSAQIAEMLAEQGGKCAICRGADPGGRTRSQHEIGRWHVDHDHRTGRVRGVLCGDCNVGLGAFRDNGDSLLNAAVYLEQSRVNK